MGTSQKNQDFCLQVPPGSLACP